MNLPLSVLSVFFAELFDSAIGFHWVFLFSENKKSPIAVTQWGCLNQQGVMIGFKDPAVLSAEKAQADHCCGNSEDNRVSSESSSSGDCSPIVLTGVMSSELDVARSVLVLNALAQSL
ncbi:TPA: hypothetical protein ACX3EH_004527 [Vibrio parahaemolyticus]|uniref:hypothetical protein n=1 Tax=Vibrio parahaemolyticus TaxID=670 RepID=UPI0025537BAA|nr:hypothetical protein [Vibrio parahaemolyticus]